MAKPLQKERENRSAETKDLTFHAYRVTPETAHTALLLLKSSEGLILCQTLRALTKFAAQDSHNLKLLFDLQAIQYVLPHIDHLELNVRRFGLKFLAQLCQIPQGPEQVLGDSLNLRKIAYMLQKMEDVFVLEFASLVLAELTREPLGCEQLLSANIFSSLFSRMKNSLDPDVQKNCLQIICNVLNDPMCASELTKNSQFSWPSLLALMQSKFLAIQATALKTVDQLICRYKDEAVQKTFRASTGVLDLCDILESYEFRDVHSEVLRVLKNYVELEENASHVYQSGCILRLLAYLEMALPALKPHCLAVLTKMSFTKNGRSALFDTGTDLVFCQQLVSSNVDIVADAAMGVANMTKLLPAAIRMSETNIIEALCGILVDVVAAWFYVRLNALRALGELCRIIPKAAFSVVQPKTFIALRNINKHPQETPIEAQRLAVQCYINLQCYHISTQVMINKDFVQELLNILKRPDISLKIMTCEVLRGLMFDAAGKDLFTTCGGEEVVGDNLKIHHAALSTALCTLIIVSVTDEGADEYLKCGTIHYMIENKAARYAVSVWEAAIEAIFKHHPSAKFAYKSKLDINDYTLDGFYVQKKIAKTFSTIKDILNDESAKEPVFICTFHAPMPSVNNLKHLPESDRPTLPFDDVNLRNYLLKLRMWFGDPYASLHYIEIEDAHYNVRYRDKCSEVSTELIHKAHVLAEFVAQEMCGLTQDKDCSEPTVDLYLADLMKEMNSRVIGLGWVRAGGSLERAVLYKVLADRVGLPCALHRRAGGKAWCEVAVPEYNMELVQGIEKYPAGLLRANYVVDLMKQPGALYKLGSYEANIALA